MRKKVVYLLVLLLVGTYLGSYIIVREHSKVYREEDGCPPRGCVHVHFPLSGVYSIYSPIAGWDKFINGSRGFSIVK